jgi:NAD(P)-dependent dehydrogenase (short-subunit alcohol dehydrogenase family)
MTAKTVLITGCSSGIGRATAETFLDDGWTVYATSRDESDLTALAEQGCRTDSLDVTVDEDVARVVDRIDDETGRVDCLVNNAGFGLYAALEDVPADRLHHQFDVNVYGPHRLARAVLPIMRDNEAGTIVNVSSVNGRLSHPGAGPYAGSKFALEGMSDALRAEVEGFGIDVVLIEPGPVDTDFQGRVAEETDGLARGPEYEWVYDAVEDGTAASSALPLSLTSEDVAVAIHDAACVEDPRARYPVGAFAKWALYTRFLPDSVRDSVYSFIRRFL